MSKIITCLSFSFLFILTAWHSPTNKDWKEKIDAKVLQNIERKGTAEFIILLKAQANTTAAKNLNTKEERAYYVYERLQKIAQHSQQKIINLLEENNLTYRSFFVVNAIHTKGDLAILQQLAQLPEVKFISNNAKIKLPTLPSEQTLALRNPETIEWGISHINADDVWTMGYTGQGVTIAGADTGYEWEHPALQSAYRGWDGSDANHNYNWHDAIHEIDSLHNDTIILATNNPCGLDVLYPCDDNNHGTHTMGTMVGDDGDENQIGVAPGAKWIACRNMERGWGSPASYIECYEWFIAPTDLDNQNPDLTKAPHVINNSWGCPPIEGCDTSNFSIMNLVVDNVKASGIVVVASAGNNGSNGCSSVRNPSAIYENAFSIGAIRQNDTIASFSSRGPVTVDGSNRLKPNVSAPGAGVRSSVRNGGYSSFSGTSMAGPHVAGLVALLISAKPELAGQVEEIETIIEQTCRPKLTNDGCGGLDSLAVPNHTYGYGVIDALKAVQEVLGITNIEAEPFSIYNPKIYPNPFNDKLYVEAVKSNTIMKIYTSTGQLISTQKLTNDTNQELNLNKTLPSGIYFYTLDNGLQRAQGKLIKY